jgi:adenine-specific DNA-methyltransferase
MTEHEEPTIKPFTVNDPEARSADLLAGNIGQLKTLFPEAFTEGKIDFEVLRQLLGGAVEEREEKYGLNWHGKRKARQLALTPSTGTLRPSPEESVEWENTKNLMIEGDNLEVLKLMQKSYSGKVKLIYIDPPYNTGKDFVYPDNFQDNIKNYLELTGQVEGGRKISSNTEASGRFHTDWLNMMYPRLKLARNLLREDGVIFISIDDSELDNLRKLCAEVFGDENFVVQIIWRKRSTPPNDKVIGANHDYILCFAKNAIAVNLQHRERSVDQIARYKNPDNHVKGPWAPGDLMANIKGGRFVKSLNFPIVNPQTGEEHFPGNNGNWRFSRETITTLLANNEIYFGETGRGKPKLKRFLCDVKEGVTYPSIWDFVPLNTSGSNEMGGIFGNPTIFESPKPVGLIQELIKLGCKSNEVVLDFFAGSGTTGHAVMAQNAADNGNRRYILVQLPEPLDPENKDQKVAADFCDKLGKPCTIAELTKERLRRAANKIKDENPLFHGDLGFRVFKLDSSNIRTWEPDRNDLDATLFNSIEHLKGDRSESDILYELLLKLGLDLCVPIEKRLFAGKEVHSIGGGVLLVCLSTHIGRDEVEPLAQGIVAWYEELASAGDTTCVFRDSAFADDVVKINLAAILQQHGLEIIRSL